MKSRPDRQRAKKKDTDRTHRQLHLHQSTLLDGIVHGNINNGGSGTFILNNRVPAEDDEISDILIPTHLTSLNVTQKLMFLKIRKQVIWIYQIMRPRRVAKENKVRLSKENREEIFKSMGEQCMWKLSTGRFVEKELYRLGQELEFERAIHSFIIDVDDELISSHFNDTELDEIRPSRT
ncbi:uncharacterized protein OCT59_026886 [Rhizophagus irregularis]|uniref:uncharacterized protein n=1 Tax=Rhizophagus irregularis TaxID=588596 RepID=UPI0019E4F811|nr:hypothetical protein OCT59_026886 [Rhizophagus irregularis]GBC22675.2 hypothetical protein GLOIN_2v1478983 [Rhizophagus irregularis DAOM 181602=DAOM 197198]